MGSTETEDEWASSAATWDEDPRVAAYAQAVLRTLVEVCGREGVALAEARVLDFGCGTGRLAGALVNDGASVVAFDTSPAMLEQLRARLTPDAAKALEPVSELTSDHSGFDLILASSVLGFVPDLAASVGDLAARLKPGALLIQWDWEAKKGDEHGLTQHDISEAYAAAGLELRSLGRGFEIEAEDAVMAPLMGVARCP